MPVGHRVESPASKNASPVGVVAPGGKYVGEGEGQPEAEHVGPEFGGQRNRVVRPDSGPTEPNA